MEEGANHDEYCHLGGLLQRIAERHSFVADLHFSRRSIALIEKGALTRLLFDVFNLSAHSIEFVAKILI